MNLPTLIAAADGVHAVDIATLARIDASTARPRPLNDGQKAFDRDSFFQTHDAYDIAEASTSSPAADADVVHVFTLTNDAREALVRDLVPLGLRKFRRGREDAARSLGDPVPGPGSDVSVVRSNRGGYQSYADLLDSSDSDSENDDAAGGGGGDDAGVSRSAAGASDTTAGAPTRARLRPTTWASVTAIALEAYARVRTSAQREDVCSRDVYGWLNVNAPGDFNKLHAHDSADRWSGVLYLAVPDLSNTTDVPIDAGCLGVRASASSSSPSPSRYFAHSPRVGDLVLFSGAALHAVSAFPRPDGARKPSNDADEHPSDAVLRVSVAFNVDC